ncbi:MAG TPA: Gfo/Idh/MocA family oxidoreductase, partial [Gemmatimonadaceae bacterium]|nr:Gfo/Idh/MocA family oxidoreductase [Gemmatimonadaceae bacterium]
ICTPPATHVSLVELAAGHGVHVLVEKPLALTLADADRAIDVCARRPVLLGVMHQQRGRSSTRALHRLVQDGRLGRPVLAVLTHSWFRSPAQLARGWRGDASAGGGLLLEQAVHGIDLLVWMLGAPRWVSAATGTLMHSRSEDTAVAIMGFANGALAALGARMTGNPARDDIALEMLGPRGAFRLEVRDYDNAEIVRLALADRDGTRATALTEEQIEMLVREEGGSWRDGPASPAWRVISRLVGPGRGVFPFRSPRAYLRREADRVAQAESAEPQGHSAVLAQMAASVRGNGAPLIAGEDARRAIAVVEAIARSHAAGGARVELPNLVGA